MAYYRLQRAALAVILILSAAFAASAQGTEELRLTVGRSVVLDYPADIRQISTSDPAIVDAIAVTTREVLLHAKAAGFATLIVWSRGGQRTIYSVIVEQNLDQLRRLIRETFPSETVQVQGTKDSISLTGNVSNKAAADRIVAMVTPFAKTVVNNLAVAPLPVDTQIMLKVKFAEVDRNLAKSFGVNIFSTGNTIGRTTTGQFSAPDLRLQPGGGTTLNITDALNIFAFRPDLDLGVAIRALQNQGLLQILAEPNLVTTNGREASFLVGGEFPIPVLQGGGNAGAVTIQFREFSIRLSFNPQLTENKTIKMYVKPEVSTLDVARGVTVSGFFIPALSTRRVETNVELTEGQSFVIGGLVDDRLTESISKIPGLGDIPLLGNLFKSREERKDRTELIVLVTPEIARPMNQGEPHPVPTMPKEFLGPIVPEAKQNSSTRGATDHPSELAEPKKEAVVTEKKSS